MSFETPSCSRVGSRRITTQPRTPWLLLGAVGLLGLTACASSGSSSAVVDPALTTPSSATEPLKEVPSEQNTVEMPDPRVGLGAGLLDAEEAVWNLNLLSATPPPAAFVGVSNSDLAFKDKYAIQGNYNGFQVWDISNPSAPVLVKGYVCPASQSDVSVYGDLLFVSGEGMGGRLDCGTEGNPERVSPDRLRGIRIFDISDIENPKYIANVQTCRGSHTHSVLVDPHDPDNVYVYVSGSASVRPEEELPGCSGLSPDEDPNSALFRIEVIRVPLANPQAAAIVSSPRIFQDLVEAPRHGQSPGDIREAKARGAFVVETQGRAFVLSDSFADQLLAQQVGERGGQGDPTAADSAALREKLPAMAERMFGGRDEDEGDGPRPGPTQCHDITLYPEIGLAGGACEGYGLLIDISDPVNPVRIAAVSDSNFSYWHSATFNNDGTKVIYTDEWGGGMRPRCRAYDPLDWGADAIYDIVDGQLEARGYFKMPAPQVDQENCVAHNGSIIPVPGRDIFVLSAWNENGDPINDPEVKEFLLDRAEAAVLKAGERSWADVVRLVPARRAGGWIASGLRSEAGRAHFSRFKVWLTDRILGQPIGSLERYGREGAAQRLTESLGDPVWEWITSKVPEVAANVRVAERVESKILEFPIPELERLVRSITEKELNLIVRLGYFLGAGIGFLLVVIRRFTG